MINHTEAINRFQIVIILITPGKGWYSDSKKVYFHSIAISVSNIALHCEVIYRDLFSKDIFFFATRGVQIIEWCWPPCCGAVLHPEWLLWNINRKRLGRVLGVLRQPLLCRGSEQHTKRRGRPGHLQALYFSCHGTNLHDNKNGHIGPISFHLNSGYVFDMFSPSWSEKDHMWRLG